jgi:hypothetical protein
MSGLRLKNGLALSRGRSGGGDMEDLGDLVEGLGALIELGFDAVDAFLESDREKLKKPLPPQAPNDDIQ